MNRECAAEIERRDAAAAWTSSTSPNGNARRSGERRAFLVFDAALTQRAQPDREFPEQEHEPDHGEPSQQQWSGEQRAKQLVVVLEMHVVRGHDEELDRAHDQHAGHVHPGV